VRGCACAVGVGFSKGGIRAILVSMRLHLLVAVSFLGLTSILASACSDEAETDCAQASECNEVVCPDGSKLRDCVEGQCLTSEACSDSSGGW
jgi:hypothetical protein